MLFVSHPLVLSMFPSAVGMTMGLGAVISATIIAKPFALFYSATYVESVPSIALLLQLFPCGLFLVALFLGSLLMVVYRRKLIRFQEECVHRVAHNCPLRVHFANLLKIDWPIPALIALMLLVPNIWSDSMQGSTFIIICYGGLLASLWLIRSPLNQIFLASALEFGIPGEDAAPGLWVKGSLVVVSLLVLAFMAFMIDRSYHVAALHYELLEMPYLKPLLAPPG